MRDPTLILVAVLVRSVDAAHPHDERSQSEAARVIEHVLIRGAFRAAVRAMKIQRSRLCDAVCAHALIAGYIAAGHLDDVDVRQTAVNFVRR